MTYEIRNSLPDDGERLVEIWRSSVSETHSFVSTADMAAIDAEVRRYLPHSSVALALSDRGEAIGFMGLAGDRLESLFVAGDWRGRSVGRCLVNYAKQKRQILRTKVNEQNRLALGFYERVGFKVCGRSPDDECGRPYPLLHLIWKT
jgi:putative acetyltransferase